MMQRRTFLSTLAAGSLRAADRKMNVLFILVDDLNRNLQCFGNNQVQTPNLDRLAGCSMRFTGAFSNYAACLPSRISFLSGWYPEKTGVITFTPNPRDRQLRDVVYLPQHFKNQGYRTGRVDKVFHIGGDEPSCWDQSEEPIKNAEGKNVVVYTPREIEAQSLRPHVLKEGSFEKAMSEKGVFAVVDREDKDLIDSLNVGIGSRMMEQFSFEGKPFFVACGLRRPHLPHIVPKKYVDMYPPERIELTDHPPNCDPNTWMSEANRRELISHYYASVTYMDARVGELLATLDRLKQAENTIIVLFGDNGYALGQRDNHYGKGTVGDLSFVVPLMIHVPGMKRAGQSCSKVVELLDLYPTLVDLCGLSQPASGLQGRSLRPLLENPKQPKWEERAIGATGNKDYSRPKLSVRNSRYRHSEDEDRKPIELFDYAKDPLEWNNLVQDPNHSALRKQMSAILAQNRN
ncbi:MAG: sulfatase [Acidobacteria bacterium]|nr:sulfatase [Acidobacteriota bacterium]